MNKYIYDILILKNYLRETFGEHVPYEIIQLIIMAGYPDISVSCGWNYSLMISYNEVYAWGDGDYLNSSQKLNSIHNKKISCGNTHIMALTDSNEVYA